MPRTISKRFLLIDVLLILTFFVTGSLWAGELQTFSKTVTESDTEFVIDVDGTLDPENIEITIENLGETPLLDPRITVNGQYDWYDIDSMVAEITEGCETDEEKAFAIWEWVHWKRFQRSPADRSDLHPVRAMNGYGYGICGHTAAWIKALCTAAGLKARVQEIWGHTVNEIYYDGGWHFFDGNVKVFYLGRDNRTLASITELEEDGWLIERTIHPRDPWDRPDDPPSRNREFVRYITTAKDNYIDNGYDSEIEKNYTMSYTLKPGETLTRWWKPVLNKHENRHNRPLVPERYANGQLVWEPNLAKTDVYSFINVIENVTTNHQDSMTPAIHVKDLHDENYSRPSRLTLPIESAYPIVGGRFWCRLLKDPGAFASVSYGKPGWSEGDLYTYRWGSGSKEIEVDLDQKILNDTPCYDYEIGFTLKGDADRNPPAQAGVEWFRSVTDLQVSPHSLPALSLGKNVIRYRDSSRGAIKARIRYAWKETDDNRPPERVMESLSPVECNTLTPTLQWKPATDPDDGDAVEDYQIMVSLRPDCRWPLSPTLYRNVGSDDCEWMVPKSFLNPDTTYYWKVRARDTQGIVGDWGKIFSFKTLKDAK